MSDKPKRQRKKRPPVPLAERVSFTTGEAADYLNIGESTVRRMMKQRRLPFVKLDASVRIRRCDLDALLQPK